LFFSVTLGIRIKKLEINRKICRDCKKKVYCFYNFKQSALKYQENPSSGKCFFFDNFLFILTIDPLYLSLAKRHDDYRYDIAREKILKPFLEFIDAHSLHSIKVEKKEDDSLLITSTKRKSKSLRISEKSKPQSQVETETEKEHKAIKEEVEIDHKEEILFMDCDPIMSDLQSVLEIKIEKEDVDDVVEANEALNAIKQEEIKDREQKRKHRRKQKIDASHLSKLDENPEFPDDFENKIENERKSDPEILKSDSESEDDEKSDSDESWNGEDSDPGSESSGEFVGVALEESDIKKLDRLDKPRKNKSKKGTIQCKVCGRYSKDKIDFENHSDIHKAILHLCEQNKITFYECYLCQVIFVDQEGLNAHLEHHEEGLAKSPFNCSYCKRQFSGSISDLKHHLLLFHTKKFECPVQTCKMMMPDYFNLFLHLGTRHVDFIDCDIVQKCKSCLQEFGSYKLFRIHCKSCNKKKFQCSHCDRKYLTIHGLNSHLKAVLNPLICDFCGQKCNGRALLRSHRKIHMKNDPTESYNCRICDFQCNSSGKLHSHIELHHNKSNTYSCKHCDYTVRHLRSIKLPP
jgi:hypothetical protein